ncbi:MAG: hypothetical protein Q8R18_05640 [bacterium]|nr:hypothetical protein [bacterium]
MDHLAILDKKRKLLQKIISGEKSIESRWYKLKKTPYGIIKTRDTIYFKDSGEPVTVKASVEKVLFFSDMTREKYKDILEKYAEKICLQNRNVDDYLKQKYKYITLIFIKDVQEITPFEINKKGYGLMAAWITVEDIKKIKKKH